MGILGSFRFLLLQVEVKNNNYEQFDVAASILRNQQRSSHLPSLVNVNINHSIKSEKSFRVAMKLL